MAEASISLWTPILYVSTLLISLVIFSNVQHKRRMQKLAETPQFYQHNFAENLYRGLPENEKTHPKLKIAALLAWGAEDFTRMLRYRENEPVMANLLQSGLVGETVFERFTGSKTLNEREVQFIAGEALKLNPEWKTAIQSVAEVAQQHAIRRRLLNLDVFKQEYYELAGGTPEQHLTANQSAVFR